MERVCFLLQVRPERIEEYKERHRAVWPEMQAALRETGWTNYSLFFSWMVFWLAISKPKTLNGPETKWQSVK